MKLAVLSLPICFAAAVLSLAGCDNSETVALQKGSGPEIITWDSLKTIQSRDIMMGVAMNSGMGNFDGLKKHVQEPKFVDAVTAFENEPIPSKYATPDREAARTELINNLQGLIEDAKANAANDQLKAKADAIQTSLKKLVSG